MQCVQLTISNSTRGTIFRIASQRELIHDYELRDSATREERMARGEYLGRTFPEVNVN